MKRLLFVLFASACGSGSQIVEVHLDGGTDAAVADASACPSNLLSTCPTPAPSWTGDVQPIYQSTCTTCHQPGGEAFDTPLDTYANAYARRSGTIDQVYSCYMPPVGTERLTLEQRQIILDWLVCGAPEN